MDEQVKNVDDVDETAVRGVRRDPTLTKGTITQARVGELQRS